MHTYIRTTTPVCGYVWWALRVTGPVHPAIQTLWFVTFLILETLSSRNRPATPRKRWKIHHIHSCPVTLSCTQKQSCIHILALKKFGHFKWHLQMPEGLFTPGHTTVTFTLGHINVVWLAIVFTGSHRSTRERLKDAFISGSVYVQIANHSHICWAHEHSDQSDVFKNPLNSRTVLKC